MKITRIDATNYQRITEAHIALGAPLLLLAGENEQGKTSIADAIYHAVTGTARRVAMKKDFQDLVHDGQKRSVVSIEATVGAESGAFSVTLPNDKRTVEGIDENPLMPYLLDANRFPHIKPEERRHLLFGITGKRISGKTILEKLREKGADPKKTVDVGAVLLAGFAAGHTEAKSKASEARGAWKATAGEVYGSKKAEDWKAAKPAYDDEKLPALTKGVSDADAKIAECNQQLGEFKAQREALGKQQERRKALVATVDETTRRQAKYDTDQGIVEEWETKVKDTERRAGTGPRVDPLICPHCAGMVELHGGKLTEHDPDKQGEPQAIALLPGQRETLAKVIKVRDNSKANLQLALDAKVALAELDKQPTAEVDMVAENTVSAALSAATQSRSALKATLDEITTLKAKADRADADTAKAAGYHKDVIEWEAIADWLAPNGIQSELLTEAMTPFTSRLATTAAATGWDPVTIDSEMTIRIGGRAYSLCSASAKWRANAALAEAISYVSKTGTLMLDEVEILIGTNRLAFLKWMHQLATKGEIETAILIGSFKEPPQCPPTYQVEWVQAGEVGEKMKEAA